MHYITWVQARFGQVPPAIRSAKSQSPGPNIVDISGSGRRVFGLQDGIPDHFKGNTTVALGDSSIRIPKLHHKFGPHAMSHLRSRRQTQSFLEFMLIIILITIVTLSILLIMGADLRIFVNDLLSGWFPQNPEGG